MIAIKNCREITLSKAGALKIPKGESSLYFGDVESSLKSMIPGEWVKIKDTKKNKAYLGFVNSLVANSSPCLHILSEDVASDLTPSEYISKKITEAVARREAIRSYKMCARMFYGAMDGLPGLIIDSYSNAVIVQVNLAGIELFRETINTTLAQNFKNHKIVFLDNKKYREREFLPVHDNRGEQLPEKLELEESGILFSINRDIMQKVGFYYDHRENRKKMLRTIDELNHNYKDGIDLFSYAGAWGMSLLKAGLEKVDFVDQGNFSDTILNQLSLNQLSNSGAFYRDNVFDFLKASTDTYDIVCCDPPAFCKSKKDAKKAYEGYSKLHKLALEKVRDQGLFIACSCTQYISHQDFNKNIEEAASRSGIAIQLLDIGMQGFDHPCVNFSSKHSYLKYFIFKVERK